MLFPCHSPPLWGVALKVIDPFNVLLVLDAHDIVVGKWNWRWHVGAVLQSDGICQRSVFPSERNMPFVSNMVSPILGTLCFGWAWTKSPATKV